MPKILYVPQRRAAYLNLVSVPYTGIDKLYTDNFSVCNILVCINNAKIVLFHISVQVDLVMELAIIIKLMGADSKFLLFGLANETVLTDQIKMIWTDTFPTIPYQYHAVDSTIDGISVSFNSDVKNTIHPNVVLHTSPLNHQTLIHHPNANEFNAVEKVEQIIAMRHLLNTQKQLEKTLFIFNGFHFLKLPDDEFDFSKTPAAIAKEFARFNKTMSFSTVAELVEQMITEMSIPGIKIHFPQLAYSANDVAYFITGYLHQFERDVIFHHELTCVLRENNLPYTAQDGLFINKLKTALESPNTCFQKVDATLKETEHSSAVIDFFKNYVSALVRHYKKRTVEQEIKSTRETALGRLDALFSEAKKQSANNNHKAAANLLVEHLHTLIQNVIVTDPRIEAAYYNAGRTLYQAGQLNDAASYLALGIKVMKKNETKNTSLLANTVKMLELCEAKLKPTSSTSTTSVAKTK